jgi:MscS family membrane protein
MAGLSLLALALLPQATSYALDQPFALEPADTSSPRATLESFVRNTAKGVEAYQRGESAENILPWFRRAEGCLDISQVSADRAASVVTESALLLYEVLGRVGLPDYAEVPGAEEVADGDLRKWTVPRTEIAIVLTEEGDRSGEYLFSPQSVARALEFYDRVKHLPYKEPGLRGSYEEYVTRPNFVIPYLWADDLPSWAKTQLMRNPLWKWIAVVLVLALGVALGYLLRRLRRRWDQRGGADELNRRISTLFWAVFLLVIPILAEQVIHRVIGVRFELQAVISRALFILAFAAAVLVAFALANFVATAIISSRRLRERSIDAHLVKVIARLMAIVAALVIVFEATEFLGFPVGPVLAGLGIGGLAVALAARPTIENVIGGFILFADKPVRVGDFCRFGEEYGTVEEIGIRSTRIRKRNDAVVTVPNAEFSQLQLENRTRIRQRLYRTTLGLRYETAPDQLRYVLTKLREMLIGHPMVSPSNLNVRFVGFGAYSLDAEIYAHVRTSDWLEYRAIREDINLRVIDIVHEAGTGFAFPSQTTYLSRDSGLDAERTDDAKQDVEELRSSGQLPFPEFSSDRRVELEDTLDFPPEGSPEHKPNE